MKDSDFVVSRVLETLHPCNCILYTEFFVIVGCDKFFRISLKDYSAQGKFENDRLSIYFYCIRKILELHFVGFHLLT